MKNIFLIFIINILFNFSSSALELVCSGTQQSNAGQKPIYVNCASRKDVVEALEFAWMTLRKERIGGSTEDMCWKPYQRAIEMPPTIPFAQVAPTFFMQCNMALQYVQQPGAAVATPQQDLVKKAPQSPGLAPASKLARNEPLKIAFAYVGPVGDGGWTYSHEQGRLQLEKEFGSRITVTMVENVPESQDAERVFRDMLNQGNTLIFGTTFGYMEPMLKLAGEFKNSKFEHATGYKTTPNMRTYEVRNYEGAYLAGVVAGGMTKSNVIGVVASIPIPEVIRNINSFTLGAQLVNPKIKTKVVWVNEWFNPPKEAEAADSLISAGADILMQNTDSPAVLQTAQKRGKRAFGWDSDMSSYAPKAHLGSAVNVWAPYYIKATNDVLNGTWSTGSVWWGMKEGAIDLVTLATDISPSIRSKVEEIKSDLRSGTYPIWKGPLLDNKGNLRLASDELAKDTFLQNMAFYVQGVEGRVPGTK